MAETRIVVGVDGSQESKEALAWALRYAAVTGARVEAVIAWQFPNTYGAPMAMPEDFDPESDARHALQETVSEVAGSQGPPVTQIVAEGRPKQVLLKAAEGADLLVVGSRGLGSFSGMLLGSVSDHVVRHAHCPVTVVRGTEPA